MTYCPSCGKELAANPNFCPECGKQIESSQRSPPEEETKHRSDSTQHDSKTTTDRIAIDTGSGRERYYNLTNLSYFQNLVFGYTLLSKVIFALLLLSIIGIGVEIESALFILVGLIAIVAVWQQFMPEDRIAIGTLADKDRIDTDDPDTVETEFVKKTSNQISVQGVVRSRFYLLGYVYHFLADNVISVEKFDSINKIRSLIIILSGIVLTLLAVLLVGPEQSDGTIQAAISIAIVGNLIIMGGGVYTIYQLVSIIDVLTDRQRTIYLSSLIIGTVGLLGPLFLLSDAQDRLSGSINPGFNSSFELVQMSFVVSAILTAILCGVILLMPRSGILISLPSDEQVLFTMSDEDVETIIRKFVE